MPPKRVPKKTPQEYHIEVEIGELELRVDAMRSEIEATLDSTVAEMRRVIEAAVLRLPARIRGMTMQQFLDEYGGEQMIGRFDGFNPAMSAEY